MVIFLLPVHSNLLKFRSYKVEMDFETASRLPFPHVQELFWRLNEI